MKNKESNQLIIEETEQTNNQSKQVSKIKKAKNKKEKIIIETKDKIKGIQNFKKMLPYLKEVKGLLTIYFILNIILLFFFAISPLIFSQILLYFTDFNLNKIIFFTVLAGIVAIALRIISYSIEIATQKWTRIVSLNLQNNISTRFLSTRARGLDSINSGKL